MFLESPHVFVVGMRTKWFPSGHCVLSDPGIISLDVVWSLSEFAIDCREKVRLNLTRLMMYQRSPQILLTVVSIVISGIITFSLASLQSNFIPTRSFLLRSAKGMTRKHASNGDSL